MSQLQQLPWSGMPNVTCTLSRSPEGLITGRCTIRPSNGNGEPIVLQAQAHEKQLAALIRQATPMMLERAAQSQVLQKLATAFRNLQRNGTPADRPINGALGASTRVQASREVLRRARNGDAQARQAVADTVAKANAGDPKAQAAAADLQQAAAHEANDAQNGATAGMVDVMSQAYQVGGAWPPPPMSLHNFYTIGGCGLKPEDFYGRATTCQPPPATASGTGRVLIGGRPFEKFYNGVRWVWRELKPQMDIRSETEGFGLRDALLLGMQRMQMRGLQA